jgi:hypothetical protein
VPQKDGLTVEGDDERGFTVYRLLRVNNRQSKRGSPLGSIRRLEDGSYEPSGVGAMFGYTSPAMTPSEALDAFIGWD